MSAFRKIYCAHCEQTYLGDEGEQCLVCLKHGGLIDPDDPLALVQLRASKQQEGDGTLAHKVVLLVLLTIAMAAVVIGAFFVRVR